MNFIAHESLIIFAIILLNIISCFQLNLFKTHIISNSMIKMVSDASNIISSSDTKMHPKEFRNLKPLPCYGIWNPEPIIKRYAIFLAPEQMRTQERVDGKHVVKGVMPIPISSD